MSIDEKLIEEIKEHLVTGTKNAIKEVKEEDSVISVATAILSRIVENLETGKYSQVFWKCETGAVLYIRKNKDESISFSLESAECWLPLAHMDAEIASKIVSICDEIYREKKKPHVIRAKN